MEERLWNIFDCATLFNCSSLWYSELLKRTDVEFLFNNVLSIFMGLWILHNEWEDWTLLLTIVVHDERLDLNCSFIIQEELDCCKLEFECSESWINEIVGKVDDDDLGGESWKSTGGGREYRESFDDKSEVVELEEEQGDDGEVCDFVWLSSTCIPISETL